MIMVIENLISAICRISKMHFNSINVQAYLNVHQIIIQVQSMDGCSI